MSVLSVPSHPSVLASGSDPILAIDIGGTKVAAGLVTPDGVVHFPKTVPTQAQEGGEAVMARVIDLALDLTRTAASEPGLRPAAVGVGTGGMVVLTEGSISFGTSAIPGWSGMPVKARLTSAVGLPVQVENDGNAMVLGEAIFGAGAGCSIVVGITVGTGIGGGITLDQHIFHGAHGFSNNIGHMVLKYNGRMCPCGKKGCLEAYASATAMTASFKARVGKDRLQAEFGLDPKNFGVKEISRLAGSGVLEAVEVLKQGAVYLGIGIASIINLLDPDVVVVGGGAAQSGDLYFSQLQSTAAERVLPGFTHISVVPARLSTWANLIGAACIVWQKG
jgi:glucokinase